MAGSSEPAPMRGLRSALVAGLAGIVIIFTVTTLRAIHLLNTMRAENAILRHQALDRAQRLATIRYCVLLSQKYVNEHLAADQVREHWLAMMSDLEQLKTTDPAGAQFVQLRDMLSRHWLFLNRAMDGAESQTLLPLRLSAIQITETIENIDAREAAATQLAIQDQFERLGHGLGDSLDLALFAALLLALGSAAYIMRIEEQNRCRFTEIAQARRDLEQLSARMVDAQENERRTISRELHDQVGQTLNAVLMDAANLASRIPPDDEAGRQYLDNIRTHANASVNAIRDIALLLRPSMLDDLGLIPALEWQARETSRRTGIPIQVSASDVGETLPDPVRTAVYRIVQEALQNVARHSHATHAEVVVAQSARELTVTVSDDGAGFDPARIRGMGLLGMEERVRQFAGRLEVHSEPGKGAKIRATLPLTNG
jgi:signal transduction histidine kinase